MRCVLCLHLPYLPTERARRAAALAADQPLALTEPAGAACVVRQACPRARQAGVRPGISSAQARALLPQLTMLSYEPQRDQATLRRLADWAVRFSPAVEPVEPDTLLLDITGCERLFGGHHRLATLALAGLVRQGFTARAAGAETVGAAYALAAFGQQPLTMVPPGQASAYLTPLPPAALRLEPQTCDRLDAVGVRTIGDLFILPRSTLPARFGPQLVLRLQQALGEVAEGVATRQPVTIPFARRRFEAPVSEPAEIVAVARDLLADVFQQLQRGDAAVSRLDCMLYFERVPPRVLSLGLARASREQVHVAELLDRRLETVPLSDEPDAGVIGLMLVARQTSRWHGRQGELFEPWEPGSEQALADLLDRLVSRLGYEAVVRPRLIDDHQPERASRYVSLADAGCEPADNVWDAAMSSASPRLPACERPLRLLPRPVPARAIALVPDGPPTWLYYQGREHVLTHVEGPERIETAWWRGPDIRRDYFRARTREGAEYWLFRDGRSGQWYVHGWLG